MCIYIYIYKYISYFYNIIYIYIYTIKTYICGDIWYTKQLLSAPSSMAPPALAGPTGLRPVSPVVGVGNHGKIHRKTMGKPWENADFLWNLMRKMNSRLVVEPPIWNIFISQLWGWLFPIYGKIQKMFQSPPTSKAFLKEKKRSFNPLIHHGESWITPRIPSILFQGSGEQWNHYHSPKWITAASFNGLWFKGIKSTGYGVHSQDNTDLPTGLLDHLRYGGSEFPIWCPLI